MPRGGSSGGHSSGSSHSSSRGSSHSHSSSRGSNSFSSGHSYSSHSGSNNYRPSYQSYSSPSPPSHNYRRPRPRRRYESTLSTILAFIFVTIVVLALIRWQYGGSLFSKKVSNIPVSSVQRVKADTKNAYFNDCIIDEIGWIKNEAKVVSQLKEFYKKTGCQPFIYLKAYDASIVSDLDRESWSQKYYDTHFQDYQNVVLYTYFCDKNDEGNGKDTLFVGTESGIVMDREAQDIFWAYLDYDWDIWDINDNDGMFVDVFNKTAERIMFVTTTDKDIKKTVIIVVGVIISLCLVVIIITKKIRRDKEKAQETIDILNTPLDMTDSSDGLIDKYK